MAVHVVCIRAVKVFVLTFVVKMHVAVLADDGWLVSMIVMSIVVTVRVLVLDALVLVAMRVLLRDVEHDCDHEQTCCRERRRTTGALPDGPSDASPDERSEREDGTRATGSDPSLGEQVEAEAQAEPRDSTPKKGPRVSELWEPFAHHHGQHEREPSTQPRLPTNDVHGIEIGEWSCEGVVESPCKRRERNGTCPPTNAALMAPGHREDSARKEHEEHGNAHTRTDPLSVKAPPEYDGEGSLHIEEQRRARSARVFEAPSEGRGGNHRSQESHRENSTCMMMTKRRFRRTCIGAPTNRRERSPRVQETGRHERPRVSARTLHDGGGDAEEHGRDDGEQRTSGNGVHL